ncbi:phage tail fiber repeat protein, partial [Pasteurella bettyae CCUG 2042]
MKTLLPEINSADKRFHAGNPATGEQGTRVTDTWLNDVQDRVRDVQAEAHYVLGKAGFKPVENKQTQLYEAIVKIIDDNRKSASTTQKGEVWLTSDTGLDSEELGLTAKAGKALAQGIAILRLALNNYIPNSKKSNAVDSNSADTVATSLAVKT